MMKSIETIKVRHTCKSNFDGSKYAFTGEIKSEGWLGLLIFFSITLSLSIVLFIILMFYL